MLTALSTAVWNNNGVLDGDAVVECSGLLTIMKTQKFQFILRTIPKLLSITEPAKQVLQSQESSLLHGIPNIKSALDSLKQQRSNEVYSFILQQD